LALEVDGADCELYVGGELELLYEPELAEDTVDVAVEATTGELVLSDGRPPALDRDRLLSWSRKRSRATIA
jgi:hypothetical protein